MDYTSALILGIVQGITEFLPVSSSGHLILAREIFGLNSDFGLAVDAVLQLATILAVAIYFFRDFLALTKSSVRWILGKTFPRDDRVMITAIVLGTIPAVVFGLLLEDLMETVFRNTSLVMITLVAGSILFLFAERVATEVKDGFGRAVRGAYFAYCLRNDGSLTVYIPNNAPRLLRCYNEADSEDRRRLLPALFSVVQDLTLEDLVDRIFIR